MAALTTDFQSEVRPSKSWQTVAFFPRAAETKQTGKPVLLRWCRSDSHLLQTEETSGLPV